MSQTIQKVQNHEDSQNRKYRQEQKKLKSRTKSRAGTMKRTNLSSQQIQLNNLQTIQFSSQIISLPQNDTISNHNHTICRNISNNNNNCQYTSLNTNNYPTSTIITKIPYRPSTSSITNHNYDNGNNTKTITTKTNNNNNNPQNLTQIRWANLINVLLTKMPEERTQKEINIIVQALKHKPFFQSVVGNVKFMEEIAQTLGYWGCKQQEVKVVDAEEFKDKCFIVIMGSVNVLAEERKTLDHNNINNNQLISKLEYQSENVLIQGNKTTFEEKLQKQEGNNKDKRDKEQETGFWSATECGAQLEEIGKNNKQSIIDNLAHQQKITIRMQHVPQQTPHPPPPILTLLQTITQGQSYTHAFRLLTPKLHLHSPTLTHMLTIPTYHHQCITLANKIEQIKKVTDFLINLQLFRHVYRYSLESFVESFKQVHYQYKGCLFKEDDPVNSVYIVKSGQFSLSKTINPQQKKPLPSLDSSTYILSSLRRRSHNYRQIRIKTISRGQIIGDSQSYLKIQSYSQTCQCISQSATVYKIQRLEFVKCLMSKQNNVQMIRKYLNEKYKSKLNQILSLIDKQVNNETISRLWPVSKSCGPKLKAVQLINNHNNNNNKQRPSTGITNRVGNDSPNQPNFFDQLNRTIPKNKQRKRINYKLTLNLNKHQQHRRTDYSLCEMRSHHQPQRMKTVISNNSQEGGFRDIRILQTNRQSIRKQFTQREQEVTKKSLQTLSTGTIDEIPSSIKDIVGMVNCKEQYFRTRNKTQSQQCEVATFHFQTHKIPRFIEQKYKHLIMRLKAK